MKHRLAPLFLLFLAASLAAAPADMASHVRTTTLANGLEILVWPDHDIPNVAYYTFYRVGSRNEVPGITGLSHFFEHMMFNGSKSYPPGEFDRTMEAAGGSNNAYTSENLTVYQDWFPRTALETIFKLEADRMANLAIDPKVVDTERGVVYSERRSGVDNDNFGALMEQTQATAFVAHPYQIPTIGWPSDIEKWSQQDLLDYYRTYYAPNNATLVVVGDVTPEEIFTLAKTYLEPIPSQPAPEPVRTVEPEQEGERRVTIAREAQVPLVQFAWHVGRESDADTLPVDLLLAILADGASSRLHQLLVETEQVAVGVGSYRPPGFDPFLAWLFVTGQGGAAPAEIERLVDGVLASVAKDGVTEGELAKAKNIALANFWRDLATINGKAQQLGAYRVFHGDWKLLFSLPARIEGVTAAELRDAAAKYFTKKNRTTGVLVPATPDAASTGEGR